MEFFFTNHWNNYFKYFFDGQYDIYFTEEYVYLYESKNEKACCLIIHEGDSYMLFPFLKREFEYDHAIYYDFETAYGYGGPICNTVDNYFISSAFSTFYEAFASQGYIAGFVRFHPLLSNYQFFNSLGEVVLDRKTVAMDLSLDEEYIWMNEIHTKNRNVIKKGAKHGLEFVVDNEYTYLSEFIKLYNSTMDKLSADGFYYFNDAYYLSLKQRIYNSFLGVVKMDDKVLSSAIFFCHSPYGHYHLSGSDKKYLGLSPNNFMLYHAALELKKRGVKFFHLGGGTTSDEDDSLFCFKKRFSNSTYQFAIGKLIFNDVIYKRLCTDWENKNSDKMDFYKYYLLKYKY